MLNTLGSHPQLALLVVALVAFAESVAIIGTFVPAAIVMFTAGALVGNGSLDLWQTLACAAFGAILGDAVSYELGRRQEARIRAWPMFRRHDKAVARGETFLRRHGGKSVILARFTGAVRAFVPLLAGFARMSPWRFYSFNVASALLWAPAHILPGVLFGSSLQLAEAVSGRLAVMVLVLVAIVWGMAWLLSTAVRVGGPRLRLLRDAVVLRARNSQSGAARAMLALLDPHRSDSAALLFGTVLLLACGWLFFGVLEDVVSGDPLVQLDHAVFRLLQDLRVDALDCWMVAVTGMGSVGVLLPLIVVVLLWLLWRRCWRTAGYWVVTVAVGELLVQLLKFTLGRQRPLDLYTGVERLSFPSGHVTVSTVVLSFLAFLLSRGQPRGMRTAIAVVGGVYLALVAFSRLYLGAHWFSDVVAGMSLGLAWVAFSALVYTLRPVREDFAPRGMLFAAVAALAVSGVARNHSSSTADPGRYSSPAPRAVMSARDWLDPGWERLPARRLELVGETEEPFQLQWACAPAQLGRELEAMGWQQAPDLTWARVLRAILPRPSVSDFPVLPRFNGGVRSRLMFVRAAGPGADAREVIRLWQSDFDIETVAAGRWPIWYGAVYREVRRGDGRITENLLRQTALNPAEFMALLPPDDPRVVQSRAEAAGPTVLLRCPDQPG